MRARTRCLRKKNKRSRKQRRKSKISKIRGKYVMHGGDGKIDVFQYPGENPEIKSVLYHDLRDFLPESGFSFFLNDKLRQCFLDNYYGLTNWKVFNPRGNGACMINAVLGAYGFKTPTEEDCARELTIGLKKLFQKNNELEEFKSTRLDSTNIPKQIIFNRADNEETLRQKFLYLLGGNNLSDNILPLICCGMNCDLIQLQYEIIDESIAPLFFVFHPVLPPGALGDEAGQAHEPRKLILLQQNGHYFSIFTNDYESNYAPDSFLFDSFITNEEFWGQLIH